MENLLEVSAQAATQNPFAYHEVTMLQLNLNSEVVV